ncbi:aldo/keto reductase [Collinsella tanakaei]|uniref:aldo/keto reductase n=1 Tax=Collinsella tanakaei TaxID=626935 RepID=UPI001F3C630F|nr:aldo/keto reductase [Collinsella tanakaei]MCF2621407.1 aldo/keto reductase [Collinsella tanakaei]
MDQERYLGASTPKLGFGFMRLPKFEDGSFDIEQVKAMVDRFMDAGMTYFDTAYVYDNGGSERALKEALVDRYPRDRFTIATKVNARVAESAADARQQLTTSLERTGAGYFDYYLLHAVQESNIGKYDEFGLWDFVREQKEAGTIRHWGFSFHGTPALLDELLTKHPDAEFVQLQINYADWEHPEVASRTVYEIARKHGKPVVIMEPVKGGMLANPIPRVQELLRAAKPEASFASWAIRYAASLDGVITVLSGMSNLEQIDDNLSFMRAFEPLSAEEQQVIRAAQDAFADMESIPCTACRYCTDGCPMHIPIPCIFAARNKQTVWGLDEHAKKDYEAAVGAEGAGGADACIACGQCEAACPQHIHIIDALRTCAAAFA